MTVSTFSAPGEMGASMRKGIGDWSPMLTVFGFDDDEVGVGGRDLDPAEIVAAERRGAPSQVRRRRKTADAGAAS